MKPLPKRIKLAGHEYTITVKPLDGFWGRIHVTEQKIEIASDLSLARQWEVLGHEMMHGYLEEAELSDAKRIPFDAEQLCTFIGHQLGRTLMEMGGGK